MQRASPARSAERNLYFDRFMVGKVGRVGDRGRARESREALGQETPQVLGEEGRLFEVWGVSAAIEVVQLSGRKLLLELFSHFRGCYFIFFTPNNERRGR